MRTTLQLLFGLVLGAVAIVVCVYLGLLLNGNPDWRTGAAVALILAAAQWISSVSFRRHIALQVLFGSALCMALSAWLLYSSIPLFWERQDAPGVYSITWRSRLTFVLLVAATQAIAFLLFRRKTRSSGRAT